MCGARRAARCPPDSRSKRAQREWQQQARRGIGYRRHKRGAHTGGDGSYVERVRSQPGCWEKWGDAAQDAQTCSEDSVPECHAVNTAVNTSEPLENVT